ncbi:LysM peptidoglycan-binding domain-containing protein [Lentiprolixibacter aurantiacus]|uniref:LysM peptidoglycan-binding domain-containing protein n=1 Tax=Lentiprolixibacter aurantiacus TaxID=2993939 RepID=A0AAE3MIP9_9FLAO|nr:LysM peptidoglycan-binding domain-containing protein [Lentiprolixibacter aurantiacus]MCX2718525.1 LysM peptidoglycan-binding domain-containing protein [Lentiprolixibacter aurantiacus]
MILRKLASVLLLLAATYGLRAQDSLEVKESQPVKSIKEGAAKGVKTKRTSRANTLQFTDPTQERAELKGAIINKTKGDVLGDYELPATYDSLWLEELSRGQALYPEIVNMVNLEGDQAVDLSGWDTEEFKTRLQKLNERTPLDIAYNPSLENVVKSFLLRKKELLSRMLTASQFYFPMFEEALDRYNIPLEIKYLSIVESALNPRAKSRVGATGLWQFMYGTGRIYGLDVNSYVDERSDPIKSTEAACQYLSKLYSIFNDWDLALAAYNSGPGNVNKAIRRSGGYENYWNLRRYLPRETAGYVPAFIATFYLIEYAEEYGIQGKNVPRPYFETDTVSVKNLITFEQISKWSGVGLEELKLLNPAYKLNIIPKIEGKDYTLRLPVRAMGRFVANEKEIYAQAEEEIKKREKPLPQLVKAEDRIRYRVRSGDYLGKIAERYGVGVSQIKRWNGLRSDNLRVGQRLTIYPRKPAFVASQPSGNSESSEVAANSGSKFHTVRKGDSLWTISQKYPGISIENLREWNGIRGNDIIPGTKLKLCSCSP